MSLLYSNINFNDPIPAANKRETILGLVITFLILSWICVLLRLYVRLKVVRAPGWDDLFVGLYLFTVTIGCVSICISTNYGLGGHLLQLQAWERTAFLKHFYVQNLAYNSSTTFIKLALMLQYLRVFDRGTLMYKLSMGLAVFTALWGTAFTMIAMVPCSPPSLYWDVANQGKHCYGYGSFVAEHIIAVFETHAATNMVLDILMLAIPLRLLFKDTSTTGARVRLTAILGMGALVIALAAWRVQTLVYNKVATWPTVDPTWYGPISILLAALETNAASICASVPIFWPVLQQNWSGIVVTQEVRVTRENRYHEEDADSLTRDLSHSRNPSELSIMDSSKDRKKHYRDSYILRQVDPLRMQDVRDHANAMGGDSKEDSRGWIKF